MEEELIKIWKSSANEERIKFERSRFMIDLQNELNRLQRSWKYMELREIIAAIVVIPIFGYKAFVSPTILTKIGAIWIVFAVIYIIFRLRSIQRYKPGAFTETYLDYLHKTRQYLKIQANLLNKVMYWYFAPVAIGVVLIFVDNIHGPLNLSIKLLVLAASGVFVYFLNKRAAKKHITPKLQKVEELIKAMGE